MGIHIPLFKAVPKRFFLFYLTSILFVTFFNFFIFTMLNNKTCPHSSTTQCPRCPTDTPIIYKDIEELTFITVPRPFMNGEIFERNKLAIHSWLSCSNRSRVLLFVNRTEFDPSGEFPKLLDNLYGSNRIEYLGPIRSDHNNIPYIDDWFRKGAMYSKSKYVCFINGDIVLSSMWLRRVKQVLTVMSGKPTVLIGQRIDFQLNKKKLLELNYGSDSFLEEIDDMVESSPHEEHSPYGIDTFTFDVENIPFNIDLIPSFYMGRYNWDNWLVGWLNQICETVTFNLDPPIYHINHRRHNFDVEDHKVAVNHHLKKANNDYFGSNYDTKWQIVKGTLYQRNGIKKISLPLVQCCNKFIHDKRNI